MDFEELSLSWSNHKDVLISVLNDLLSSNSLVDCTLAAEGQCLKAHKVVLSASSPYFQLMFSQDNEKHPIVFLKDVKFNELKAIIDFVYLGEVKIKESQLGEFLEVANSLQIRGLNGIVKNAESQRMFLPDSPPKRKRKNNQPLFPDVACDLPKLPLNDVPGNNLDQPNHHDSFSNFPFEFSTVARSSSMESCNMPPEVQSQFPNASFIAKQESDFQITVENEFVGGSNENDAVEMNNCGDPSEDVIESTNQQAQYGQASGILAGSGGFDILPSAGSSPSSALTSCDVGDNAYPTHSQSVSLGSVEVNPPKQRVFRPVLKSIAKNHYYLGESRGTFKKSKRMGTGCDKLCRLKCTLKISAEDRLSHFKQFWVLNHSQQYEYLSKLFCTRDHKNKAEELSSSRKLRATRKFWLISSGKPTKVCRTMFLDTFCISHAWLNTVDFKKARGDAVFQDERGRHNACRAFKVISSSPALTLDE